MKKTLLLVLAILMIAAMVMTSCSLKAKALDEEHDSTEESGLGTDYVSNNSNIFYQEGEFWNTYVETLKNIIDNGVGCREINSNVAIAQLVDFLHPII